MKVVFLCNRLSRTKLRGSWQAMLDACHGHGNTQEIHFATANNLLTGQLRQEDGNQSNREVRYGYVMWYNLKFGYPSSN